MEFTAYKKKPVEIQATQLTKEVWQDVYSKPEHKTTVNGYVLRASYQPVTPNECFYVETLEDVAESKLHKGQLNDFLIIGVQGEIYACKPDIFHETYEKV